MSKNLILTISIGYRPWFKFTKTKMNEYALKYNCDFKIIDEDTNLNPRNLKCNIYDLLDIYDRIIYFDDSCVVNIDTPNLFDLVPTDKIGVFIEPRNINDIFLMLSEGEKVYNLKIHDKNIFFNSGVMVISKCHKQMFEFSELKNVCGFYDQVYLNCKRSQFNFNIFPLDRKYNYMIPFKNNKIINNKNIFIYHVTRGQLNRNFVIFKLCC